MNLSDFVIFANGLWLGFVLGIGAMAWAVRRRRQTGRLPNVGRAIGDQ